MLGCIPVLVYLYLVSPRSLPHNESPAGCCLITDKNKLYIATSPYNGTGNVYELDLPTQKSRLIWQRGKNDCIALLQSEKAAHLLLQVSHCDNNTQRQVPF